MFTNAKQTKKRIILSVFINQNKQNVLHLHSAQTIRKHESRMMHPRQAIKQKKNDRLYQADRSVRPYDLIISASFLFHGFPDLSIQ